MTFGGGGPDLGGMVATGMAGGHPPTNGGLQKVDRVRSVFPETWLWTNTSVG